jgi:adenylate cyclase
MLDREAGLPEDRRIRFRIGINLGDIIVDGDDIFGDGVNVAARLEALAEPGGLCISRMVRDQIRDKLGYAFEDLGEQILKNIARPVRAYALSAAAVAASPAVAVARDARSQATPSTAPRLSIVVLPFANLSNDPEQEYFADGITDDLTTDLSRISGSFVIARNTAFTYKGKSVDVKQVGRELGVRYVLEGSVRRIGDQVRVNVQLIDAETAAHIWADRFETERADVAKTQDAITGRLARTLNLELVTAVGRRIEGEMGANPDASDFVMRGWAWYHRRFTKETLQEAQRSFERALTIDPGSVDARIGVAAALVNYIPGGFSSSPQQDGARAEQLLLEALNLDPNHSLAHWTMGNLRRVQGRLVEALHEFEATIALDPNHARAIYLHGLTLMYLGEPAAGILQIEKAVLLNPRDPNIAALYNGLGVCHLLLGHVDEAIDLLKKARAANPRLYYVHMYLAGALGLRGNHHEASAALAELNSLKPQVNSLAALRAFQPFFSNPRYLALAEKTLYAGLRQAGFPEE